MLDTIAIAWVAFCIVVLAITRANRYVVLATLGAIALACYFAAAVWMNGALSVALDDRITQQHARAATSNELLAGIALSASALCLVLAWRLRPRRGNVDAHRVVAQRSTR